MGIFDSLFRREKKEAKKCAACLRPVKDNCHKIGEKYYCTECYNRKMAVLRQQGDDTAAVKSETKPAEKQDNQQFRKEIPRELNHQQSNIENNKGNRKPITCIGTDIIFADYTVIGNLPLVGRPYCYNTVMRLDRKNPEINIYEEKMSGKITEKTKTYVLETEGDEDFTGKYFHISIRLSMHGMPAVPAVQIDGFISDTPEERKMTLNDIGYRMEAHFLDLLGNSAFKERCEMQRGQDLPMKALKYPGYTTPSNVRLIGVCPECGKSFAFHGYSFYMTQSDVAYSDDGLSCCEIREYNIDKDTWKYEEDGKVFRYYNSFRCPHCGEAYIDYENYHDRKVFGVSGCVLLGTEHYTAK